jgi:hypothetical protein
MHRMGCSFALGVSAAVFSGPESGPEKNPSPPLDAHLMLIYHSDILHETLDETPDEPRFLANFF